MRVEVNGEQFDVVQLSDAPGQYDVTWVSGPNPGYGFTTATSDGSAMQIAAIEDGIKNFLAQVDPGTGHIE